MKRGKIALLNLLLPLLCALVGMALLYLAALLPSSLLADKLTRSAQELSSKSAYVFDNERVAYVMDYNTDAVILMESYTLDAHSPETVLTNPMLWLGGNRQVEALRAVAAGEGPNVSYSRYWMGFRLLFRPLLALFSYDSINWLLSLLFFSLFALVLARAGEKLRFRRAACFGLALILVNPAVAAHSPQYVCCFVLSFAALLVLLRFGERLPLSSVFCALGVLTQFFDFYTVPVLTLGLPLLLCLEAPLFAGSKLRAVLRSVGLWLYGYVGMWLTKLLLTNLLTGENGLADGLASLAGRLTRVSEQEGAAYRAADALRAIWETVFPGMLLPLSLAFFGLLALIALFGVLRAPDSAERDVRAAELLVGALPLVWFCVASQPTVIHAWFQHRGIAVTFCALFLCVNRTLTRKPQG